MDVGQEFLEPGARWTFVHSSGVETEYVFERVMAPASPSTDPKVPGLTAVHALLNPTTGKHAMVTEKWLCEGPIGTRSHWLPKAPAMTEIA